MGFIRSYLKRIRVVRLAREVGKIWYEWGHPEMLHARGHDPLTYTRDREDRIKNQFFDILLSYDSFDWLRLREKHQITKEKLDLLWHGLFRNDYCLTRSLYSKCAVSMLVMDSSVAMEYLLDYEGETPDAERYELAARWALNEIQELPWKEFQTNRPNE